MMQAPNRQAQDGQMKAYRVKGTKRAAAGISAAVLKHTAYASMLIDHFCCVVFLTYLYQQIALGYSMSFYIKVYEWGRHIGRIAFILFAYMAAEGFVHTRNKERYLGRLGIFALLSEIPFDLALNDAVVNWQSQNVYFTLFFGVFALYLIEKARGYCLLQLLAGMLCMAGAVWLRTDYMLMGVLLIIVFYLCRHHFWQQAVLGALTIYCGIVAVYMIRYWEGADSLMRFIKLGTQELYGLTAFVWIYFYNGTKGRQLPKLVYYLFYPLHLLALYGIKIFAM